MKPGDKLYMFMKSRGLSQSDIASVAGLTQASVSNIVNNKVDNWTALKRVSEHYGISIAYFEDVENNSVVNEDTPKYNALIKHFDLSTLEESLNLLMKEILEIKKLVKH